MVKRASWLSITPEPERELPEAVATLSCGGVPPADAVARERARLERLVLHGSARQWLAYLHGVVELIDRSGASRRPERNRRSRACARERRDLEPPQPAAGVARPRRGIDRGRPRAARGDIHRVKEVHEHHRDPTPTAPGELTAEQLELRQRAAEFVDDVLIPLELEAEERHGRLPEETVDEIRRAAIAARLHGGRVPVEHGGQGWSMLEWFLVNEQFGRVTNGLHWHVPNIYNVLLSGTPEQIERYVAPALRGEGGDAYAVTEAEAGSDPGGISSTAVATDGGWRINGEKWFVTSGDVARVLIVMANVVDGADRLPTLFLIEPSAPGVEFVDDPKFTHNYPHGHPTIRFTRRRGRAGRGDRRRRQRPRAAARLVHRGAARDRHPRPRCDVRACSTRRSAGRRRVSRAAPGSSTTRGSRSRLPTRPPTRPPAGCWRCTSRSSWTPRPT